MKEKKKEKNFRVKKASNEKEKQEPRDKRRLWNGRSSRRKTRPQTLNLSIVDEWAGAVMPKPFAIQKCDVTERPTVRHGRC